MHARYKDTNAIEDIATRNGGGGQGQCDSSTPGVSRGNAVLKVLYFENTKLGRKEKRVLNYRTMYIVECALTKPS
jgi:hypothetical protein